MSTFMESDQQVTSYKLQVTSYKLQVRQIFILRVG